MSMNFIHEFKGTSMDNVKQIYTDKLEVACESIIKLNYRPSDDQLLVNPTESMPMWFHKEMSVLNFQSCIQLKLTNILLIIHDNLANVGVNAYIFIKQPNW